MLVEIATEIATGLQAFKAAAGVVKTLQSTATEAQVNEVKIELQGHLLAMQGAMAAAQTAEADAAQTIRGLEQQIVKLKDWETEKQRWELKPIDHRAFAYIHKPGMENGEPPHWLCTDCFEQGHRSVLQYRETVNGMGGMGLQAHWHCGRCKNFVSVFFQRSPATP